MADTDLPEADFYRVIQATTGLKLREIREIEDVFDYFDTDHDGSLTQDQAVLAWKTFGIFVKESELIGGRNVRPQRFVQVVGKYNKQTSNDNGGLLSEFFQQMFYMIRSNHGKITITCEELLVFLKSSGMPGATLEESKKLVEAINRFGFPEEFTEEEFVKHMLKAEKRGYLKSEEERHANKKKQRGGAKKRKSISNNVHSAPHESSGNESESSVEASHLMSGFGF